MVINNSSFVGLIWGREVCQCEWGRSIYRGVASGWRGRQGFPRRWRGMVSVAADVGGWMVVAGGGRGGCWLVESGGGCLAGGEDWGAW